MVSVNTVRELLPVFSKRKKDIVQQLTSLATIFETNSTINICCTKLVAEINSYKVLAPSRVSELLPRVEFLLFDIEAELDAKVDSARADLGFSNWGEIPSVKPQTKQGIDFTAQTIFKAMNYEIEKTFVGEWLTMDELVEKTGLSAETITAVFKDYTHLVDCSIKGLGITPRQFAPHYRLNTPFKLR
jgi:hypothetical protein